MNFYGAGEQKQKRGRQARKGKFPLPSKGTNFKIGDKVQLRNGQVTEVTGKDDRGFYELEGFPGKCFSASALKPAP